MWGYICIRSTSDALYQDDVCDCVFEIIYNLYFFLCKNIKMVVAHSFMVMVNFCFWGKG